LGRRRGVIVEMGKILQLIWDLVARSCMIVSKAPQKAKVRSEVAKRVRHERSKEEGRGRGGTG
jgi:hypothetical protein